MKTIVRAGLAAGLLSVISVGHAQDDSSAWTTEMRPYISEMYSYTFENNDSQGVEAGHGGLLSVGKALSEHWGLELGGFYNEFPHDDSVGARAQREYGGKLDALYFYSRNRKFSPYFAAAVGGTYAKLRGTSTNDSAPLVDAGLGFMKFFSLWGADLGFRADLRYRYTFFDDNALGGQIDGPLGEVVAKVGLVIPLGSRPVVADVVAPPSACADSDGDGVCDTADLCPGTTGGTAVDAKGCPKQAPAAASKKFEDVHFAFDKSDIAPAEAVKLDRAATAIDGLTKTYPGLKVDVSGHTDWVGTDGYNQGLSERRANSVKSYLVRKGVSASRINTFAFGESKPIATNETAEGRAMNRRAEVQTHE